MENLADVVAALERIVNALDPRLIDADQAELLVGTFEKGVRLCSTGRTFAARRAAECHAWKREGFRNPADWLASKTKTSSAEANEALEMAEQIESLPATREALVGGEITLEQAAAVASAASVDPGSERRLLEEAERSSLRDLQRQAHAARVAASQDQVNQRDRIHQSRYLRTWTAKDGAFEGRFRLTADHGALVAAALDVEHKTVFAAARAEGRREPSQAYAADALVNLARNTLEVDQPATKVGECPTDADAHLGLLAGPTAPAAPSAPAPTAPTAPAAPTTPAAGGSRRSSSGPRAVVNIRVDYTALRRGFTEAGEVCEITNGGPISVEAARHAMEDAYIRLHLYDGDRLIDVANPGRNLTAGMRYGLEQRDPTCRVPGCDTRRHLQIHHIEDVHLGGEASLTNLVRVCGHHHELITHHGATLTGTPGHWTWNPPIRTAMGSSEPS